MRSMRNASLLVRIRVLLVGFIIGLVLSGLTAIPLSFELKLLSSWLHNAPVQLLALHEWIFRVRDALVDTDGKYPFLAYGTDWLAFAHLMIALAFIGPLRDPVRNRWVLEWAMICCACVPVLAFTMGPVRGIPWGWTLVDCAFGVVGFPPLFLCWRMSRALETEVKPSKR